MRKFRKGKLVSIVDVDDRRISDYLANGWKEEQYSGKDKEPTRLEQIMSEAVDDVNKAEGKKAGKSKGNKKVGAEVEDDKINPAIEAKAAAEEENEAVDDGLITKEK